MFPDEIEPAFLQELEIEKNRGVRGWGHPAFGPIALIEYAREEIRFVIEGEEVIIADFDFGELPHREVGTDRVIAGREDQLIEVWLFRRPGIETVIEIKHAFARGVESASRHELSVVIGLDVREGLVADEFRFDLQLLLIEIRFEFDALDIAIIRHIFEPNALPNPARRRIPNAPRFVRLFSTRENRGIGIVLSRHFNHVGLIEIRNVNRDWSVAAHVMGDEPPIEIDIADLIDRIEVQNRVMADIRIRHLKAFPIVHEVARVDMNPDSA